MKSFTDHINQALLQDTANGNQQAFANMVTPFFDHLFGFALSVTKSAVIAEEVVQDVFVQIWRHRAELPAIENIQGWIFTIARNKAYNAFQKQLNDRITLKQLDDFFAIAPGSSDDQILVKESEALIHKAVSALPEQQAQVFRLSRMQHLSLDEIAERLQISKETVKKHLTRALKSVRTFIQAQAADRLLIYCWFAFNLFG